MRTTISAAVGIVLLATCATASENYAPGSLDRYFRFEWQKTGRTISGYVYNTSNRRAERVQLVIEGTDGSGKVVSKTATWVLGGVPPNNRSLFEAKVPDASSYRVRILSFEWVDERRDLRSW